MRSYDLTEDTLEDLRGIHIYIAQDNPLAAAKVIDAIFEAFDHLADQPFMGHKREDLTAKDLRFWSVYSYLILYDPNTQPISIVRVLSGWRDVAGMMG